MSNTAVKSNLPLERDIKTAWILSFICAVLMGVVSLFGLLFPESIYKTEELIQSNFTNDIVNLILGLPILLGSMWLTNRGKLVGLLFWPRRAAVHNLQLYRLCFWDPI